MCKPKQLAAVGVRQEEVDVSASGKKKRGDKRKKEVSGAWICSHLALSVITSPGRRQAEQQLLLGGDKEAGTTTMPGDQTIAVAQTSERRVNLWRKSAPVSGLTSSLLGGVRAVLGGRKPIKGAALVVVPLSPCECALSK